MRGKEKTLGTSEVKSQASGTMDGVQMMFVSCCAVSATAAGPCRSAGL